MTYAENKRKEIVATLKDKQHTLREKSVLIGIDAFVDKIVKPVKSKDSDNNIEFFPNILEYGEYIVTKSGKSCGIEICQTLSKYGGNGPIMAVGMASYDVLVDCIAPVGFPDMVEEFNSLPKNVLFHTVGNPGVTTALEFDDGKVMLNYREPLNVINWAEIKNKIGIGNITQFFEKASLIGMVNWNGMMGFNDVLKGIIAEVVPSLSKEKKIMFFDMADFSGRTDIMDAIKLLEQLNEHFRVILGLNENEMLTLYEIMINENETDLHKIGQALFSKISVDALVLHTLKNSIAWSLEGEFESSSLFCVKPKLSTGGGDNFNAGLCLGLLLGLDYEGVLYIANATSGYYVRNAKSPNMQNLIDTLDSWDSLIEV